MSSPSTSPADPREPILVIEPAETRAARVAGSLAADGYQVRVAADVDSGVRAAQDTPPALVLVDERLRAQGGAELERRLRAPGAGGAPPVIWMRFGASEAVVGDVLASVSAQLEIRHLRAQVEALRAQNERLAATIELLPDATFIIDNEKKVVAWNRAAEELTGVPKEEILGKGDHAYAEPLYGDRRPILIDLVTAPDPQREATYGWLTRVGDKIVAASFVPGIRRGRGAHLWGIAAPLVDREGRRFGAIEVFRDVSEFERIQADLQRSVSLLQVVLDSAYEGILALSAEGRFQMGNRRFFQMWGLSGAELAADPDASALRFLRGKLKDPQRLQSGLDELSAHPERGCRVMLELLDGRIVVARCVPMRGGEAFAGRVWSFQDVTERVRAERALRQSEQLFKDAFFGIPDVAGVIDLENGHLMEINDRAERILGWRREELVGRPAAELEFWPSRRERARVIHEVEAAEQTREMDFALRRKDGQLCLVTGSARVVEIRGHRCAVLLLRDITERSRAERERAQLASIVEHSEDGIIGLALDGTITSWNRGAEALYQYSAEEMVGRSLADITVPEAQRELEEVLERVRRGEAVRSFEAERRAKDGTRHMVSVTVSPLRDASGRVIGASSIGRDISERRRLEEDLRNLNLDLERRVRERTAELSQSERKYRELVESANSIILRWDTQGRITFLNDFGQRFFGFREEQILGRSAIGTIVPEIESSGRNLAELLRRIEERPGEFVLNENENTRSNGERVWIAWTNRPVCDAAGELVEILSVGNDITALKRTQEELVRAKEAAESADRLKSVFLATMSHELRTPLNSIIGFTGILLQGLAGPLNEEQAKQLSMVLTSARHLHALINDVLDLSKIEAGQLQVERAAFDFREAAQSVLRAMEPLASKKGLALRLEVGPEVGTLVSDRRRVEQVLMNLVSNAIKFTEEGQVVVTSAGRDGTIETSVRDTGIGIKPEDQKLLFRPFQQVDVGLTRKHEGTGLGLSICRRLLELLGGTIEVHSEPGAGSTFTFRLPRHPPGGAP